MKQILKENLIIRESLKLTFKNGEYFGVELDSLSVYSDIVKDKFLKDIKTIQKPSTPGNIIVNLNQTMVEKDLAELIANEFLNVKGSVKRLAFVGLKSSPKRCITSIFKKADCTFAYTFKNDYEKAKEWLFE